MIQKEYKNKLLHIKSRNKKNTKKQESHFYQKHYRMKYQKIEFNILHRTGLHLHCSENQSDVIMIDNNAWQEEEEEINNSFDNVDVVQKGERPDQELSWVKKKFFVIQSTVVKLEQLLSTTVLAFAYLTKTSLSGQLSKT
ncbi:hypothetical protein T01_8261 [Trichinella spiralis]|uniref:Uncharacterized protein n=1 Tax=Trichinella spiralis TaxID=6334 RepID=A0A0V1BZM1_TRISP|nr:hypothetical protein T01_8261 [Trichinella spiralis]